MSGGPVRLSVPGPVLSVLLRYCYTDTALLGPGDAEPLQTDDLELLCGLMAAADHVMADRLKEICEVGADWCSWKRVRMEGVVCQDVLAQINASKC